MSAEKRQMVKDLTSEPKNPGPNPNINTTISFVASLPLEELYCPVLACEVYD